MIRNEKLQDVAGILGHLARGRSRAPGKSRRVGSPGRRQELAARSHSRRSASRIAPCRKCRAHAFAFAPLLSAVRGFAYEPAAQGESPGPYRAFFHRSRVDMAVEDAAARRDGAIFRRREGGPARVSRRQCASARQTILAAGIERNPFRAVVHVERHEQGDTPGAGRRRRHRGCARDGDPARSRFRYRRIAAQAAGLDADDGRRHSACVACDL